MTGSAQILGALGGIALAVSAWPGADASAMQQSGQVADSSAGRAGQRQRRDDAQMAADLRRPTTARIENRVQSRLRTRIDQNYDPRANAQSPFIVAAERTRRPNRTSRR